MIILISYTLYGRSIRQTELDNALTSGMKKAMEMLEAERGYAPESDEELVADFMEAFLIQIESWSDITVHILEADYKKGLISVEAIADYTHPIGTKGSVACKKTMILERYSTREEKESCEIQFFVQGSPYKTYVLEKGSVIPVPKEPKQQGKQFKGWKDMERGTITVISGMIASTDQSFIAVFE